MTMMENGQQKEWKKILVRKKRFEPKKKQQETYQR